MGVEVFFVISIWTTSTSISSLVIEASTPIALTEWCIFHSKRKLLKLNWKHHKLEHPQLPTMDFLSISLLSIRSLNERWWRNKYCNMNAFNEVYCWQTCIRWDLSMTEKLFKYFTITGAKAKKKQTIFVFTFSVGTNRIFIS